jgi:sn-glycerol 3-phosphate transport system permease protein
MFIYMARMGMLDQLLSKIGLKSLDVLSNKGTVLPAMSVMYVWREAGYLMIFFLSGLQNISIEMYEAATIDGARGWTVFRKITLPLLGPTLLFVSTIALTNSLKLVDHVVIMTEGAPNNASTMLLYYVYQQAFTFFDQANASALTVIMLVIMLIVSMFQFVKTDRKIYYN